ncbi:MAG: MFS transporter [Alicyclobacillaceae bacterium]|nr:MFS transporter [Alicyclobacillaceae bacterium]
MENGRSTRYELVLLATLFFTWGFVFIDRLSISYLMPFISKDLHLDGFQIGLLSSGFSFTWAIAGVLVGMLSDRMGRKKAWLMAATLVFSLCSMLSGTAAVFAALLLFRMLMGLSEGPVLPIAQSMLAQASSEKRRGFNMGLLQTTGPSLLAQVLGPIVIVALANALSWRVGFYLTIIPGLILVLLIWRFLQEPKGDVYSLSEGTPGVGGHGSIQRMEGFKDVIRHRNIWVGLILGIFFVLWYLDLLGFTPTYLVNTRHISSSAMSLIMSAIGLGGVVWGFGIPAISDRFGRKPVMVIFTLVSALFTVLILFIHSSLWLIAISGFLASTGQGCFPVFMSTIPAESVPVRYISTSVGMIQGVGEIIGGVVGSALTGLAADKFGFGSALWIAAGCMVAAFIMACFLVETAPRVLRARRATASSVGV